TKLLTKEDEEYYKWYEDKKENDKMFSPTPEQEKRYKNIKKIRGHSKTVNFSATYGAGPSKIAETLGCTLEFATTLHKGYWERNKAIKKIASVCKVKIVNNQKW